MPVFVGVTGQTHLEIAIFAMSMRCADSIIQKSATTNERGSILSLLKSITLAGAVLLPTTALAEWSGGYIGGSVGSVTNLSYDVTTDIDPDVDFEDGTSYGAFIGGYSDANGFVIGYEVALEFTPDAAELDDEVVVDFILDLKLSGGVPVGDALLYGILAVSSINGNYAVNDISAGGFGLGVGAAIKLTDNFSLGGEYISRAATQEFDLTDLDATADTFTVRAAYHF